MKGSKQLQAEIIKMLPDKWNYQDRIQFFEQLAEIYRKKSRESVYRNDLVVMKTDEGYKSGGKG
jgi:hypothetical protein